MENIDYSTLSIILGTSNAKRTSGYYVQKRKVSKVEFHEDYNEHAYWDIALVKMDLEVNITALVFPICLPEKPNRDFENSLGQLVSVVGYAPTRIRPTDTGYLFSLLFFCLLGTPYDKQLDYKRLTEVFF